MTQHLKAGSLEELVEKLEAAEAGSTELDGLIAIALGGWSFETRIPEFKSPKWWPPGGTRSYTQAKASPPAYTTSVDVALALAERVLGDLWKVRLLAQSDGGKWFASLVRGYPSGSWSMEARSEPAPTPALALCIAILKARLSLTLEGEAGAG